LIRWQKILVPFRELCEQEEGRAQKLGREGQYGTLWRVLHGMNFMYDVLEKAQAEVNRPEIDDEEFETEDYLEKTEHYNTGINMAVLKLDKYFKLAHRSPLYIAAIVLHPSWRFEYFEDKWVDHPDWIRSARKTFKSLFQKYAENASPADSTYESCNLESTRDESGKGKSSYLAYDGFSADYLSRRGRQLQKRKDTQDLELDGYLRSFDPRLVGMKEPLVWWKEHQTDFPILSRMAFDAFSIPAMSSEVERAFSVAKRLITDERNSLGSEVVEACETQRHWLMANIVH
jgi:hAT family protein